jgi:predicted ester cyclase
MTSDAKSLFHPIRLAMRDFTESTVRSALQHAFARDAIIHLCHPFGDVTGPDALFDTAYAPLLYGFTDLERRDWIVMSGQDQQGGFWLGAAGQYMGTFHRPWLDIPPTGHIAMMRCHEFYRFEGELIVEMQAIWDIPEVMMQAGAWPLAPSLGKDVVVASPATQDGLAQDPAAAARTAQSVQLVVDMLNAMKRHPHEGGPELMELSRFWHPRMNWYGPAGIGTSRGIRGFRHWHQIPYLNAMPDRGQHSENTTAHFFGEGDYVAVTGWPNMAQTISDPGWLGIAPTGQFLTMCSLDFWRVEDGLIRENWVLIDLMDTLTKVGLDPFARMREFNKARVGFDRETGRALP